MNPQIKSSVLIAFMSVFVGTPAVAKPETQGVAAKPPLGWNSFDSYGVYLHEKAAMENLEAMASGSIE